jgi:hypothetical protein
MTQTNRQPKEIDHKVEGPLVTPITGDSLPVAHKTRNPEHATSKLV